jgi:cation diffusion facilitator CzcD-associated flavoprotein CzcO
MSASCTVAVVGAGPYGLAVALRLHDAGVETRVFGKPMEFWSRHMPAGMLLRSSWEASQIAGRRGDVTLAAYQAETGKSFAAPVPLSEFVEYGQWFQRRFVPDVDVRSVALVERRDSRFRLVLEDGELVLAERVVVAAGIGPFARRLPELAALPADCVSHAADHVDLGAFAGCRVLVVGGGQSALESAALLHEAGAAVEVVARASHLTWLRGGTIQRRLGRAKPVLYGPTDVGPAGMSRVLAHVGLTRAFPRPVVRRLERRAIRPAGARWLVDRLEDVPMSLGRRCVRAGVIEGQVKVTLDDGTERLVDHVLCGTGYEVDVARYAFLSPELVSAVVRTNGYPVLQAGFESSVPGLHFVGAPAARSYGPVMRFVSGTWYTGRVIAKVIAGSRKAPRSGANAEALGSAATTEA